jgi:hypothetical protein
MSDFPKGENLSSFPKGEILSGFPKTFLLEHGYVVGSVDQTLFTLNHGTDFLLVQIYMDDIIFGGSSHSLVSRFQEMMESEFQMSMM